MEHIAEAVGQLFDSVMCYSKSRDECGASMSMQGAAAPAPAAARAQRRGAPNPRIVVNDGPWARPRLGSISSGSDGAEQRDLQQDYPGRSHIRVARNAQRQSELASQNVRKLSASVIAKNNEVNALKIQANSPTGNAIQRAQYELAEIKSAITRERRAIENARSIEERTREAATQERRSGSIVVFARTSRSEEAFARSGSLKNASKARKGA